MTVDITKLFQEASTHSGPWLHSHVEEMVEVVAKQHPDARSDWEPGDEEWARVLRPDGGVIALICAKMPLGFICGAPPPEGQEGFTWLAVPSTSEQSYRVDPKVLDRVFGRAISRNVNWDAVSIEEVWWATVS